MQEPKVSTKPIAENRSSYKSWVASEGVPIIQGFFIEDIRKVALEPGSALTAWRRGFVLKAPVKPTTLMFARSRR
jgi:hypothetical protein